MTDYQKYWLMTKTGTFVDPVPLSKREFYEALTKERTNKIMSGEYTIVAEGDKALVELEYEAPKSKGKKNVLDV